MKKDQKKPTKKQSVLVENVDFYIENGNYVFTAHYLTNRGYCCENRCRHCPYGFTMNQTLKEEKDTEDGRF